MFWPFKIHIVTRLKDSLSEVLHYVSAGQVKSLKYNRTFETDGWGRGGAASFQLRVWDMTLPLLIEIVSCFPTIPQKQYDSFSFLLLKNLSH